MDHVHHPREAGQGLRSLHPGRVRPLQGHDQHRLQLSPARADRRQLGRGEFDSFFSSAMLYNRGSIFEHSHYSTFGFTAL